MATGAASPKAGRQGRFNSTHSSVVNMDVAAGDVEDEAMSAAKAAKHRHNRMAYWIMTLLGAGMLFPWNAVVNAVGYFNHLYPGRQFEFYVALAYISPQLIVVAAMVKVRRRYVPPPTVGVVFVWSHMHHCRTRRPPAQCAGAGVCLRGSCQRP